MSKLIEAPRNPLIQAGTMDTLENAAAVLDALEAIRPEDLGDCGDLGLTLLHRTVSDALRFEARRLGGELGAGLAGATERLEG